MALKKLGWVAAAMVACTMIWYSALGHKPTPRPSRQLRESYAPSLPSPASLAGRSVARINDRVRVLELRDSVLALSGSTGGFSVEIGDGVDPFTRGRLDSLLRTAWMRLRISSPQRVIVAVVLDSAIRVNGLPRTREYFNTLPIETFLPSADTRNACVTVLRLRFPLGISSSQIVQATRSGIVLPETISSLLGPCALVARFGVPGPGVSEWLAGNGWEPARFAEWNAPATPWTDDFQADGYALFDRVLLTADPDWRLRRVITPRGIACLANLNGACASLFNSRQRQSDSVWRRTVVASSGASPSMFFDRAASDLGPAAGSVVSEMVRVLGPERFQQFWTSELPADEAFAKASGGEVGSWIGSWARRMYGPASVGPTVGISGVVAGFVFFGLTLVFAAYVAERRRVI